MCSGKRTWSVDGLVSLGLGKRRELPLYVILHKSVYCARDLCGFVTLDGVWLVVTWGVNLILELLFSYSQIL